MLRKSKFDPEYIKRSAKDILFPPRCAICDELVEPGAGHICRKCKGRLNYVSGTVCLRCGRSIISEEEQYCPECQKRERTFDGGFPVFNYVPPVSDSIVRMKYHDRQEYSEFYAEEIVKRFGERFRLLGIDVILPVPIHRDKYKTRGYNQAGLIARGISEMTRITFSERILIRNLNTEPQKELGEVERERNLRSAFEVDEAELGKMNSKLGKNIKTVLLVDDIYTTGATIEACTRVLRSAGIKKVYYTSASIGKSL